jgi:hypothetical protein
LRQDSQSSGRFAGRCAAEQLEEGPAFVEWANLPHDFAETLELVFVGITIVVTLGILVAFGHWWQR